MPRSPRRALCRVKILPREEAFQIPDLIRTKINLLPEGIKEIRTVEIAGLDLRPTAARTLPTRGRSGGCGWRTISRRARSTSGFT